MGRQIMRGGWTLCLVALLSAGCATRVRQPLPPQWPATWDGRQLYNTPSALIYARHESVANDVEDRIKRVQDEFLKRTGGSLHQGLVIVNDTDDPQMGDLTPEELLGKPPPKEVLDMGITPQELAMMAPMPLTSERLAGRLGFSPDAVKTIAWAAALPSDRRLKQFASHMIDAGMKKANVNLALRVLIFPITSILENMIDDALLSTPDVTIYTELCARQTDWDDSRRKKESDAYKEEKIKKMVKTMEATTQSITTQAAGK